MATRWPVNISLAYSAASEAATTDCHAFSIHLLRINSQESHTNSTTGVVGDVHGVAVHSAHHGGGRGTGLRDGRGEWCRRETRGADHLRRRGADRQHTLAQCCAFGLGSGWVRTDMYPLVRYVGNRINA